MQRKLKVKAPGSLAYAHEGDAGMDLASTETVTIPPHGRAIVGTGVCVELPSGCFGAVYPRSGLSSKQGVTLANCVGVVDSGYRGEVKVPLLNTSDAAVTVEAGQRVAQLVVQPYVMCEVVQVGELGGTERGSGGFGSTGL